MRFEFNSTKQRWYAQTDQGLFSTDIHPTEVKSWKKLPDSGNGVVFVPQAETVELDIEEVQATDVSAELQKVKVKMV